MTATVPVPAVVAAVKERVSLPSTSVSLAITSVLLSAASSATVNVSSTATGVLLIIKALLAPKELVAPGLAKVRVALFPAAS